VNTDTDAPAAEPAVVDGRSARWEQHRTARRADLLHVARRLVHVQGPDVTMEDIASASGTSKSVVYRYFRDKDDLASAIAEDVFAEMTDRFRGRIADVADPHERLGLLVQAYCESAAISPDVYRFVIRPSAGLGRFLEGTAVLVARALPTHIDETVRHTWAAGAVGFVRHAVDRWMSHPDGTSPADLARSVTAWILNGAPR
jgi:AcrR family transcriptional regulator